MKRSRISSSKRQCSKRQGVFGGLLVVSLTLLMCSCGSDTSPLDVTPAETTLPPHIIEPTEEMKQAAERQCRQDEELDEGYVQAVDPESGQKLMEYSVDCSEVDG